jgi:hypothetical protein
MHLDSGQALDGKRLDRAFRTFRDLPCSSPVIPLRHPARAIFSPVRQAGRFTVKLLIMLVFLAILRVVFGAKTKISAVIRQK